MLEKQKKHMFMEGDSNTDFNWITKHTLNFIIHHWNSFVVNIDTVE